MRLWVTEQAAYSHILRGAAAAAEGEYATLAASGYPGIQDIGVAGLIDLHLADGKDVDALAACRESIGERAAPGLRSVSRIADWLQKENRVAEAIEVLNHLSESDTAMDSERAWALLQLQSLYQRNGDYEKAIATGWRLQGLAPPGDASGEAGLKMLVSGMAMQRAASADLTPFPDAYRRFLDANPGATDPARQIVYAAELRRERRVEAATALYEEVGRDPNVRQTDRATAMLCLQRLRLESGQLEQSAQTGMALQESFPKDFGCRLASWRLIRAAGETSGGSNSLRRQTEEIERALADDLRSYAQDSTDIVKRRAQALLLQFKRELEQ